MLVLHSPAEETTLPILMASVRDMLIARQEELVAKMEPLFPETARLRRELIDAEALITEIQDELRQIVALLKKLDEESTKKRPPTIMEAVLEILRHKPNGMTAREILGELNAKYFDGKIARHSLSPQLSRLKDRDKKLELRGDRWFLLPEEPSLFAPKR
jgi:DNA repair exonuclease SbcCD ATPase subunit